MYVNDELVCKNLPLLLCVTFTNFVDFWSIQPSVTEPYRLVGYKQQKFIFHHSRGWEI